MLGDQQTLNSGVMLLIDRPFVKVQRLTRSTDQSNAQTQRSEEMIVISSRKNFWEPIAFSTREVIRNIDLNNAADPGAEMSDADFKIAITGKKLLLLIHGYNNKESAILPL